MTKDKNEIYEDIGKEFIKHHVGSQWASVVYKSIGIGYTKLLELTPTQRLFLSKKDRVDLYLANVSIAVLDSLKCAEIANISAPMNIYTNETMRCLDNENIEIITMQKVLWLSVRSNINVAGSKDGFGVKDFVTPIAYGTLTPIIGPAGAGIAARHFARYDEADLRSMIFVPIKRTSDTIDAMNTSIYEVVGNTARATAETMEKSVELAKDITINTLDKTKEAVQTTFDKTKDVTAKAATKSVETASVVKESLGKLSNIWGSWGSGKD